jgi:uracil-DNA glycosylase family 4
MDNKNSNKLDLIMQVSDEVIRCTNCELCQTRNNAVPGEGSASARIMFVGEAPGRFEDAQGKPFVGPAGKILEAALLKANLARSQVFITNIVKCRPPGNRRPKRDEIIKCNNYLNKQISVINPKIVCILGATAYSSLLGGKEITLNRGKLLNINGRDYFLTIHPAATLYRRSLLRVLEEDMLKLSKLIFE